MKHQITTSMAKDIAFKLGAELNDEEADVFADGYNAAMLQNCATAVSGIPVISNSCNEDASEMLRRLAIIMSGCDTPGEIRSLTVTAQSLVDRCKQLAREKELRDKELLFSNSHVLWKPASAEEVSKRSVRDPARLQAHEDERLYTCPRCGEQSYEDMGYGSLRCCDCGEHFTKSTGIPTREETQSEGELISCPRCGGESHKLVRRGWIHYWCDACATGADNDQTKVKK